MLSLGRSSDGCAKYPGGSYQQTSTGINVSGLGVEGETRPIIPRDLGLQWPGRAAGGAHERESGKEIIKRRLNQMEPGSEIRPETDQDTGAALTRATSQSTLQSSSS